MARVAVIGGGISGLAAAYLLSRRHQVQLFERDTRLGGHTNTVTVEERGVPLPLDTGFLVHNDRTYPNLVRLFREIGIETRDSDMSFGVACQRTGLEYSSRGANGFFADRPRLLSLAHWRLLGEILRFNREARSLLDEPDPAATTLGDFLDERRFTDDFNRHYLLPMASAIWSTSMDGIRGFPAATLIRFFDNHGLLGLTTQPTWKVVANGSHAYIPRLTAPLADRVVTGASIAAVRRDRDGVTLAVAGRPDVRFDEVVFACHGDQVLPLLEAPSAAERRVLGSFETTRNIAWLHTDASLLPSRPRAWASWNYLLPRDTGAPPTVTYDLNRLQGLRTRERYCVTLNPTTAIDEARVIDRFTYRHPLYTRNAIRAQARWDDISGCQRTHYCGAYWGYGFHEDGLNSAIRVARALGVEW